MTALICFTTTSLDRPDIFVGLISFNKFVPTQVSRFQCSPSCFNFRSSNNCNRKFCCTFGDATTKIRCPDASLVCCCKPICLMYVLISSAIPIALHVLPVPNPW